MSFLSTLAHIGGDILGFLPVPGAGVASKVLGAVGDVGNVMGSAGATAAAGRRGDADLQARMNIANNRAQLDAAQFNMNAPETRLSQAAHADVLANAHNAPMTGDPRIDKFSGGGLRPDLFGADTRAGANDMKRQALMALMTGSDQQHPQMSGIPDSGILEKIGGIVGLTGGLAGAVGPYLPQPKIATMQKQPQPDWTPPAWDPEQGQE